MTWTQVTKVSELKEGQIVRHRGNRQIYHVTAVLGDRAIGVRSADITNPSEWESANLQDFWPRTLDQRPVCDEEAKQA